MEKTILLGEKEMKLKSSAATNILYKRVFHEDILLKLGEYSHNIKEMERLQTKVEALRADKEKPKEQVLSEMTEILNSDAFTQSSKFQDETLPRLAFIMYVEANVTVDKLMTALTDEQYLFWLMTIDRDELLGVVGQVMDIWQAGAQTHSKPKN